MKSSLTDHRFLSLLFLTLTLTAPGPTSLLADEEDGKRRGGEARKSMERGHSQESPHPERGREREHADDREREHPRGETPEIPGPDLEAMERRIHHLRIAAENLDQADLHREADRLREHAEDLERELRERHHHREEEPGRVIDRLHLEIAELHEIVRDLREEIGEMREEMEELREASEDDD